RRRRVHDEIHNPRLAALRVHLLGSERRVTIHRRMMMTDVAIGVVLEILCEVADRAVRVDRLVDEPLWPICAATIVEAKLIVGIPVGGANPAPQVPGDARNAVARDVGWR